MGGVRRRSRAPGLRRRVSLVLGELQPQDATRGWRPRAPQRVRPLAADATKSHVHPLRRPGAKIIWRSKAGSRAIVDEAMLAG